MRGSRKALVIGNAAYGAGMTLKNPVNDARLVAGVLKGLGFVVDLREDLDATTFVAALATFIDGLKADKAEACVFYFAGHGAQVAGENFLIPIGSEIRNSLDLESRAIKLPTLMTLLDHAVSTSVVFLDCCRSNPLPIWEETRARGVSQGLMAPESFKVRNGSYVAFSTMSNSIADDGDGDNSPFSECLADLLSTEDRSISDVMARVRGRVRAQSKGRQVPMDWSMLVEPYVFNLVDPAKVPPPTNGKEREEEFWSYVKDSDSVQLLDSFMAEFPRGKHYQEALKKNDALKARMFKHKLWRSAGKLSAAAAILFFGFLALQTARLTYLTDRDIVGGDMSLPIGLQAPEVEGGHKTSQDDNKNSKFSTLKGLAFCHLRCIASTSCVAYTYERPSKKCYLKNEYISTVKDAEGDRRHFSAYFARPRFPFLEKRKMVDDVFDFGFDLSYSGPILDADGEEIQNIPDDQWQSGIKYSTLKVSDSVNEFSKNFNNDSIFCIALCLRSKNCHAFVHSNHAATCKLLGKNYWPTLSAEGKILKDQPVFTGKKLPDTDIETAVYLNK